LVNSAPEVLGWLYDFLDKPNISDKPGIHEKIRLAFDKLNTGPFIKLLKEYRPDVAICTHFLPSEIISNLRDRGEFTGKLAVVVTDFDVHAMWLCAQYERFFVALEETKVHLEALGMPPNKITVSGIPIDPVFSEEKPRAHLLRKHGLVEGSPIILVSAGGFGVGPIEHLIQSLLKLSTPAQVLAVCGRSEELRDSLSKLVKASPASAVQVHVLGFTKEMDELMTVSDLVIGKPGGLTTSEALSKGLPFVIVNPIPGQEERNSDHLLEQGAAIRCNNLPTLAFKVDHVLSAPERLKLLKQRARALGHPTAAFTVAQECLSL
jgi:processive 1,2-diacylglycerol beta-glucosyltransferase